MQGVLSCVRLTANPQPPGRTAHSPAMRAASKKKLVRGRRVREEECSGGSSSDVSCDAGQTEPGPAPRPAPGMAAPPPPHPKWRRAVRGVQQQAGSHHCSVEQGGPPHTRPAAPSPRQATPPPRRPAASPARPQPQYNTSPPTANSSVSPNILTRLTWLSGQVLDLTRIYIQSRAFYSTIGSS